MKKCYLLLCLMALTSLLLICNSVLADEQNSEVDRWKFLEEATVEGTAETGSLIGAAAASAAAAETADQGFKSYEDYYEDYKKIIQDKVRSEVTDPKDQMDANEESPDHPALGLN